MSDSSLYRPAGSTAVDGWTLSVTPEGAGWRYAGLRILDLVFGPEDVVVCAAGSMPGDLHKLWRTRDPKGYHVEYGYSTMGYEIAGGLGVKLAAPERDVFVMVGDGSYLMMAQELVTAVQERLKVIVVLVQNHGFQSIGALSESLGSQRFGTAYRYRGEESGRAAGPVGPVLAGFPDERASGRARIRVLRSRAVVSDGAMRRGASPRAGPVVQGGHARSAMPLDSDRTGSRLARRHL